MNRNWSKVYTRLFCGSIFVLSHRKNSHFPFTIQSCQMKHLQAIIKINLSKNGDFTLFTCWWQCVSHLAHRYKRCILDVTVAVIVSFFCFSFFLSCCLSIFLSFKLCARGSFYSHFNYSWRVICLVRCYFGCTSVCCSFSFCASSFFFLPCNHYITVIIWTIITQGNNNTHTQTHIQFESGQYSFRFWSIPVIFLSLISIRLRVVCGLRFCFFLVMHFAPPCSVYNDQ